MRAMSFQQSKQFRSDIGIRLAPLVSIREHVGTWADVILDERKRSAHLHRIHQTWRERQKPFDRTLQFWRRSAWIYARYKFCQVQTQFLSTEKQKLAWEIQHEWAADKVYALCSELGGFFLKVAQVIGKPDLAPDAWVRKLVTLCDTAPATPYSIVKCVLEQEFGAPAEQLFEEFEEEPIGSASVAQVHRGRIRGMKKYVAIKVQHPGVEELMMTDIRNLKAFAAFVHHFDIKFDMLSALCELEEQVGLEFDFVREAKSMDKIADSLYFANHGKPPVLVPRSIPGLVTRQVLTMDFIEGFPLLRLGEVMRERGMDPDGTVARIAQRRILKDLTTAYGQMILRDGFFQADPHPGNILVTKEAKVALLDYGQVKHLPNSLRLDYAKFILALSSGEPLEISRCLNKLGVVFSNKIEDDPASLMTLTSILFDTKLPPGKSKANPFFKDDVSKKYPVKNFPKELFFILRTIHILRGLSVGMGISFSCADEWRDLAMEAVSTSCHTEKMIQKIGKSSSNSCKKESRELIWKRRKRIHHSIWCS